MEKLQLCASYSYTVSFWDRVCAIGEFICGTPVHKGQKRVTVATNFGAKIAINAFPRDIARMSLLITGGFRGRPIQRRHFWLQRSMGRCRGNHVLAKICKKYHKMAITSVSLYMRYPSRVWFWDWVCAIGEFICDTLAHKRQREVTMATNFWTKITINAFLQETMGM